MAGEPAQDQASCTSGARDALRVTVLCGGPSAEREISLDSGRAVADALRRSGHQVHVADIYPDQLEALDHPADVVFPVLHGTFGEDGQVQRLLEERGIPYVGSDSCASALAIDKAASKAAVRDAGIDTPAFEVWTRETLHDDARPAIGVPVIVKPVDQGSSVGTSIVRVAAEFPEAVRRTLEHFDRALVEQFVVGEELTVGIVGDRTLPPICVRPKRAFYDYEAKYHDDQTEYLFEAGYDSAVLTRVQELSRRVFGLLGCRHLARIDWMIDRAERLWFLEVNTLPGFTSHSLVPKAAAHVGVSFEALVDRIVRFPLGERA